MGSWKSCAAVVAVCLATAAPATAQEFEVGVKGGFILASLFGRGSGVSGPGVGVAVDSRLGGGLVLGVLARTSVSERVVVQGEVAFVHRSEVVNPLFRASFSPVSFGLAGLSIDLDANYVQLPVTVRYRWGRAATRPYVLAGGGVDFNVSASADAASTQLLRRLGFLESDISERVRSTVPFVTFGVGVDLGVGRSTGWSVEMRYDLPLQSAFNDLPPPVDAAFESDDKLSALFVSLAYRF